MQWNNVLRNTQSVIMSYCRSTYVQMHNVHCTYLLCTFVADIHMHMYRYIYSLLLKNPKYENMNAENL